MRIQDIARTGVVIAAAGIVVGLSGYGVADADPVCDTICEWRRASWPASWSAQSRRLRQPYAVSCGGCRIEIARIRTLGAETDSPLLSPSVMNVTRARGGRVVAASFDGFQLLVFDSTGGLEKRVGRRGEGPGEFGAMIRQLLTGPGDTVYVFNSLHVHTFTPTLEFVRRAALPAAGRLTAMAALGGGRLLMGGLVRSRELIGHPWHVMDDSGRIVRSFGYDGQSIVGETVGAPFASMLRLAGDRSSFWRDPGGVNAYSLIRLDSTGTVLDAFEVVDVPWLNEPVPRMPRQVNRGWDGRAPPVDMAPPQIGVQLAGVDDSGLLWIQIRKPVGYDVAKNQYRWEWRIEVFDPLSAKILASSPSNMALWILDSSSMAISQEADEDGVIRHTLWRVMLQR